MDGSDASSSSPHCQILDPPYMLFLYLSCPSALTVTCFDQCHTYLLAYITPAPASKSPCTFPLPVSCSSAPARRRALPVGRCDLCHRAGSGRAAQTKPSQISGEPASSSPVCSSISMELPRHPKTGCRCRSGSSPGQPSPTQVSRTLQTLEPNTHVSSCASKPQWL